MKVSIELPGNISKERLLQKIDEIEANLKKDARSLEMVNDKMDKIVQKADPWTNSEIELPSVDTKIEDLSINHDHYLYGTQKK